ncbi:MAG: hypothetical protein Kow006_29990 [Gammaproteobacteria bacterium]
MEDSLQHEPQISESTYQWSVKAFTTVKRLLKVNIKLHHSEGQIDDGQIFLFNHFARFETFIPQYLIYQETGAYCRSVASAEFFSEGDAFSNYLYALGAVPNNHPRLLPFLAEEILRGRKVVVFPEGGMVKDRRVLDRKGRYSIYSPTARERRKHHTGAALLALVTDVLKDRILRCVEGGDEAQIARWMTRLHHESPEALVEACRRPSLIVPANITFYPIRIGDNLLRQGVELISRGLSRRMTEELMIEGNILLRDTDMDIRLGDPVDPAAFWRGWERQLFRHFTRDVETADQLLTLSREGTRWGDRAAARWLRKKSLRIRDRYMHRMYSAVTVHLSHLASRLIMRLLDQGVMRCEGDWFFRVLYLALKNLQHDGGVFLHRSLQNPECYFGLIEGKCFGVEQFLSTAASAELVEWDGEELRFLPKLCEEHEFHSIRLENPVAVYANEVEPLMPVSRALHKAAAESAELDAQALALLQFDDERVSYRWDRAYYRKPRYAAINDQETADKSGEPFLHRPPSSHRTGVLLVHGFLASPAELAGFGARLAALGYVTLGIRLKGHGTSPWDLRDRRWEEWMASVERGYRILSMLVDRVCIVGFSTGGALALNLAADHVDKLAGVAAVSVPLRFRNRNMIFVPLLHGANRVASWIPAFEGIIPFRLNESEHPHINYRHIPVRGLYELRQLVDRVERRLEEVRCPVLVLQGTEDHVVEPRSAEILLKKLGTREKRLHWVESDRHGILNEAIGDTQECLIDFIGAVEERRQIAAPVDEGVELSQPAG